jgi:hypothetical protein
MFKVLVNTDKFDLTNDKLVERTIKDLWTLKDIHEEEIEIAMAYSETEEEAKNKVSELKDKIKDTDHDLDILCKLLWGDLAS